MNGNQIAVLALLGTIVGAAWFVDDRWQQKIDAAEIRFDVKILQVNDRIGEVVDRLDRLIQLELEKR